MKDEPIETRISHSLHAWATALSMEPRTLETRLIKAGFSPPKGNAALTARQIYVTLMGDKEAETVRALKLDNEERERNAKEAVGQLFPMDELEPWLVQNYTNPMITIFESAATTLDTRCNGEHPEVARRAIGEWIEGVVKPALKAALEKPKRI